MIDAEKSDLFDVLAYIAFALAPITREERVNTQRRNILALRRQASGVPGLRTGRVREAGRRRAGSSEARATSRAEIPAVSDAARELGGIRTIRETFIGFQKYLYARV